MSEYVNSPESQVGRQRLEYGAVPLEPWTATHPDDGGVYSSASMEHIAKKLRTAMAYEIANGWVVSPELAEQIRQFTEVSLLGAQAKRIAHNSDVRIDESIDQTDPLVEHAFRGTATPQELFELIEKYPCVSSIELAKLSHPFDFEATGEMDDAIADIILNKGEILNAEPRYKKKRLEATIPAAIVVRKQPFANIKTEHGTIQVVQRMSLLARGDKEIREEAPYVDRMIKNPERFDELVAEIEDVLGSPTMLRESNWLRPTTTSYYAKYIARTDETHEE